MSPETLICLSAAVVPGTTYAGMLFVSVLGSYIMFHFHSRTYLAKVPGCTRERVAGAILAVGDCGYHWGFGPCCLGRYHDSIVQGSSCAKLKDFRPFK